ncbi:MAG: hypothetical protein ISP71_06995 [Flavobacteriales bacterium]|nr:hypothetical protein [Flavobacteriales bacterium]
MKQLAQFLTLIFISLFSVQLLAQSPGISYQAVILSNQGQQLPGENVEDELLASQELAFRFKIYNDDGDEFVEIHRSVYTDRFGMVNLVIGWGDPEFQTFDDIIWDGKDKWLDVYIDFTATGTNFEVLEERKPLFSLISQHLSLDKDLDPNNETQAISFSDDTLFLSNGGKVFLGEYKDDTDQQDLTLTGNLLGITNGTNTIDLTQFQDGTGTDNQQLTLNGTDLSIDNGNSVDLSSLQDGTGTDNQTLELVSGTTVLSISGGNFVNLAALQDGTGTDNQQLTLSGTSLSIDNGNSVDLSSLQDGTGTDNQDLQLNGTNLSIDNGTNVIDLSLIAGNNTDNQQLTLSGTSLSIDNGNSVDLSSLQDGTGTDNQQLTLSGTSLSIDNGNSVDLSSLQDGTGTDNQQLTLSGTSLSIDNANSVDLSSLQDGTGTDNQDLQLNGTNLTIDNGTNVIDLSAFDNDKQNISGSSFMNNVLTIGISNGTSETVDLSSLATGLDTIYSKNDTLYAVYNSFNDTAKVDLSATQSDDQQLSFNNDTLYLEDGGFVDLSALNATEVDGDIFNEIQNITLANDSLFLSLGGGAVDLSTLKGTDDQQISFANDSLFLENGGAVDLSDLVNAFDTIYTTNDSVVIVTNKFQDTTIINTASGGGSDGDAWGVNGEDQNSDIGRTGKVGIGTTSPQQALHVNGQVRIDSIPNGVVTDSLLVVDANGDLKKVSHYKYMPVTYSSENTYTVLDTDEFVVFQGGQNPINVTLPDPASCPGRVIVFAEETNNGTSVLQFLKHTGDSGGVLGIVQNVWSGNSNSVVSTGNVWLMKGSQ